jgi:hypothetical protein
MTADPFHANPSPRAGGQSPEVRGELEFTNTLTNQASPKRGEEHKLSKIGHSEVLERSARLLAYTICENQCRPER